ncbi:MAG: hypothetical protein AVDCRST_MAG86-4370 [uncultured Truepera sp.]|uniref:Uncharacterized protein n=1 Tax=uncultured Truepera sp. TaxID=543023 RepID=A0A6J4VXJ9_9DEIN|nr:MAG: hypothetical protein AVDCRST_MAG86-4370 [uncultured Truepera sp.]
MGVLERLRRELVVDLVVFSLDLPQQPECSVALGMVVSEVGGHLELFGYFAGRNWF